MLANRTLQSASMYGGYQIQRSLRFRASASAYLQRTFGVPTNNTRWTWSGWVKRGRVGIAGRIFGVGTDASGVNQTALTFSAGDDLDFFIGDGAGSTLASLRTAQVFRDPSAWYHVIFIYDSAHATANSRQRMFVNGVEVTAFSLRTNPGSSQSSQWNQNGTTSRIGVLPTSPSNYFDGYMADVNFVDGQALDASNFGQIDSVSGVWSAKRYTGSYGTNGFYLNFADNSALTTASNVGIGRDGSGNGNYWTTNNISITAGSTYDSMLDVPLGGGGSERGNYCTLNPLRNGLTLSDTNLSFSAAINQLATGTIGMVSGKWYWEVVPNIANLMIGLVDSFALTNNQLASVTTGWCYYGVNGFKYSSGSGAAYGATFTSGDVIGVALDADSGTLTFYKNGSTQGVAYSGLNAGPYFSAVSSDQSGNTCSGVINFGQRPFTYTPPTGFKALHTGNLPAPTIRKPNQYFDTTTYAGTSAIQTIINSGAMRPDLVWMKARTTGYNHLLQDSVRGVGSTGKKLASNLIDGEASGSFDMAYGYVDTLNVNGFSLNKLGTGASDWVNTNKSGDNYVAWQWRAGGTAVTNNTGSLSSQVSANPTAGFSIVKWTGNGSNAQTIGHGLGQTPGMIIHKATGDGTYAWNSWHKGLSTNNYIQLNTTSAQDNSQNVWPTAGITSSVITTTSSTVKYNNLNGVNHIAYVFAEVAGYSRISSYAGNGSTDGPFVHCGFRPKYIMIKNVSTTYDWYVYDTARGTYNVYNSELYPNDPSAEVAGGGGRPIDILSSGFKIRNSNQGHNSSGNNYIFIAFAEVPFKYALAR